MPRAKRVCLDCPAIIPAGKSRCPTHERANDQARGTKQQRGYGYRHDRERRKWQRLLDRRPWPCSRCGELIHPGEPWHLDHTDDRTGYLGPSHPRCNDSAGGRASHQ